jgi:hypothetical protein
MSEALLHVFNQEYTKIVSNSRVSLSDVSTTQSVDEVIPRRGQNSSSISHSDSPNVRVHHPIMGVVSIITYLDESKTFND